MPDIITALKQERSYWCYPTVASMATGISVDQIIEAIGHDGSRIINPDLGPPCCHAAFEFSELALGLLKLGWALVPLIASYGDARSKEYPSFEDLKDIIEKMGHPACATVKMNHGYYHAVYWDTKSGACIDPLTGEEFLNDERYPIANIELFVRVRLEEPDA